MYTLVVDYANGQVMQDYCQTICEVKDPQDAAAILGDITGGPVDLRPMPDGAFVDTVKRAIYTYECRLVPGTLEDQVGTFVIDKGVTHEDIAHYREAVALRDQYAPNAHVTLTVSPPEDGVFVDLWTGSVYDDLAIAWVGRNDGSGREPGQERWYLVGRTYQRLDDIVGCFESPVTALLRMVSEYRRLCERATFGV